MRDRDADQAMGIIMAVVILVIVAGLMMSCTAHAARGCLDKDRAARTWPTKQIAIDGDGCFTYMRKGMKPVPVETPTPRKSVPRSICCIAGRS